MRKARTRATAFALVALFASLPIGCDDEETTLPVLEAEEVEGVDPDPNPIPPPPSAQDRTPVVPAPPATQAPPAGEQEPTAAEPQGDAVVAQAPASAAAEPAASNSNAPADDSATVRIFLSDDDNPDFGYIVAAQLDAWMPGETPACKAKFESWSDKKRKTYNKRLEGIVRYLVYNISDSFKTRAEVYGGKLEGEDVEAMSENDLREWLSAEPTRLELYAVARWHLPHSTVTVPLRFGGAQPKPPVEEVQSAIEAPATKPDADDPPPHADEPETPPEGGASSPPPGTEAPPAPPAPPSAAPPPEGAPAAPPPEGTPAPSAPVSPPATLGPASI